MKYIFVTEKENPHSHGSHMGAEKFEPPGPTSTTATKLRHQ